MHIPQEVTHNAILLTSGPLARRGLMKSVVDEEMHIRSVSTDSWGERDTRLMTITSSSITIYKGRTITDLRYVNLLLGRLGPRAGNDLSRHLKRTPYRVDRTPGHTWELRHDDHTLLIPYFRGYPSQVTLTFS
jgi:hypothetical protein